MYGLYGLKRKKKKENELYGYVESIELHRSNAKLCALDAQIVWICRKFEYLELLKLNGKLCTL